MAMAPAQQVSDATGPGVTHLRRPSPRMRNPVTQPPSSSTSYRRWLKTPMAQEPKARVALLVETARVFGRDLLKGIARYSREHGPWSFHISPGDYEQVVPKMKQWGGTGIIARIPNQRVATQ